MRKHLLQDFTQVYHLDLHGNVRQNPKLSGTTHNVFGIQVGVGITVAVRSSKHLSGTEKGGYTVAEQVQPNQQNHDGQPNPPLQTHDADEDRRGGLGGHAVYPPTPEKRGLGVGDTVYPPTPSDSAHLHYHRVPEFWTGAEKLAYLTDNVRLKTRQDSLNTVDWEGLTPDARHTWRIAEHADEFAALMPMGSKAAKAAKSQDSETIFKLFSHGINTSRDKVVYNYNQMLLIQQIQRFVEAYNLEVDRFRRSGQPKDIDNFVRYTDIKWSLMLKEELKRGNYEHFNSEKIRVALYRPFTKRFLYFSELLVDARGLQPYIFPDLNSQKENLAVYVAGIGDRKGFGSLVTNHISSYDLAFEKTQTFPFYTYDPDGGNRRENITDWALAQFRAQYGDETISKWDIFYYVYALLHHPVYRERYADNLKRDLPRIPYAPEFRAFADAGKKLADLHLNYETLPGVKLEWQTKPNTPINYRVKKMRLMQPHPPTFSSFVPHGEGEESGQRSYKVYDQLVVNETLTLAGIPPEAFAYRLGNRSALEWIVDQYQVKTDKRSGITSDPNAYSDDEQYIVRLVERVVQVSVETAAIVAALAGYALGAEA
jgi:predicted helicase